jgi:SSS family solute:Na+ symporter
MATLHWVDYTIMVVYMVFVLGIGLVLRRVMRTSTDFFLSGRSIPAWITGLAFISANLGAQEVIGMGASGAKYGILTSHFYWIGAIPAMVFVGIFMMPFYYGSRARSVPEYLKLRFDEKTRAVNAFSFAAMTVMSSGVSMYAMGKLFNLLLGWDFNFSILVSAVIVLFYIFLGGLTSAIYNEVLQFFLIVFGFIPLVLLGIKDVGGWSGLSHRLQGWSLQQGYAATAYTESWAHLGKIKDNPMHVEWFGLAMGLGFVLSFGYWCTDFLVVQRAMAANSMTSARRTPLIAAIPKMLFPFLVIVPGMIALVAGSQLAQNGKQPQPVANVTLTQPAGPTAATRFAPAATPVADLHAVAMAAGKGLIPAKLDSNGQPERDQKGVVLDYDMATPMMLLHYFPTGILGLGLTALLASFMSGMAGNVTAFNTVWTYDIYQSYIHRHASDNHYLWMGRFSTVGGIALSIGAAYFAMMSNNIMDLLQLVFAFVNAPLFATFALGMFWRRTTGHGAFWGLLSGTFAAAVHHALSVPAGGVVNIVKGGYLGKLLADLGLNPILESHHFSKLPLEYGSEMGQNFWTAIWAFSACFVVTIVISLFTRPRPADELKGLVYSLTEKPKETEHVWYKRPAALAVVVLLLTLLLNFVFF